MFISVYFIKVEIERKKDALNGEEIAQLLDGYLQRKVCHITMQLSFLQDIVEVCV